MDETFFQHLGANEDTRTDEQKAKDFKFEEIVSAPMPVSWVEKPPSTWTKYPIRNQDGSSTCVAQSMAKIVGALESKRATFPVLSAASIYNKRKDQTVDGMIGTEAMDIALNSGLVPEVVVPSQLLSEAQVRAQVVNDAYLDDLAKAARIGGYVQFSPRDFDSVASTIQATGKPVMVWFTFTYPEWTDVPTIISPTPNLRHSVTAVDVTLYQGQQCIIIEDSWGKFGLFDGQRAITRAFYEVRNLFAAYPIGLKLVSDVTPKPDVIALAGPKFGDQSDFVKSIQDFLKWNGTFPVNVESTGFYGAITARAVLAFMVKYGVTPSDPQGRLWGANEFNQAKAV
jgi:hypothetical protein